MTANRSPDSDNTHAVTSPRVDPPLPGALCHWQDISSAHAGLIAGDRIDLWVVRLSSSGKSHDEHRAPDCYWKQGRWHSRWRDGDGYEAIPKHYTPTHWRPTPAPPVQS